jgi:hypothetical protein
MSLPALSRKRSGAETAVRPGPGDLLAVAIDGHGAVPDGVGLHRGTPLTSRLPSPWLCTRITTTLSV